MRSEEGFVDMAQEYKIYIPMNNHVPTKELPNQALHKSIEFQLIKTSAFYLGLDLPEKYKQTLVTDRNS